MQIALITLYLTLVLHILVHEAKVFCLDFFFTLWTLDPIHAEPSLQVKIKSVYIDGATAEIRYDAD